jgi:competence protein ComEA
VRRRAWLLGALLATAIAQAEPATLEVNAATRAELESLPGVGPALAARLLAARPYADWPDLMHRVSGIKAATAHKLSAAGLRVGGQPFSKPAVDAGSKAG